MEWYTVHIAFPAKDDLDAVIKADAIVKTARKKGPVYVDRNRWDVSIFEDWAEQIRTVRPGGLK